MKWLTVFVIGVMVGKGSSAGTGEENQTLAALAINEFAFDLLSELPYKDDNQVFSSVSISAALAMTYNGARNNTRQQIRSALHLNEVEEASCDPMAINNFYREMITSYSSENSNYTLNLADGLFVQRNFSLREEFLSTLEEYYDASTKEVNFGSGEAEEIINKWVENQTNNKINKLYEPGSFTPLTVLVLANAIYFKGLWENEFSLQATIDDDFHVEENKTKSVKMMRTTATFPYYEDEEYQVLKMPYRGDRFSMLVILPKDCRFSETMSQLNAKKLSTIVNELESERVSVKIPKFKLERQYSLKQFLEQLNITDMFSESAADLSGMSPEGLFVSSVVHKALLQVDEKGTEAAAATGVAVNVKSMPAARPRKFFVDCPFFVAITDDVTDVLLFAGTILDPDSTSV